ncbi:MAG: FtsX-like permease family protein [Clostridiales bacterium]|nr:FtsX-like permease family protein [Clostridiales bacterium]
MPRFIAIFAIIALGVGFFAGLKITTPSMIVTGDKYTKDLALFDFKFLSTIGFTDDDISELGKRTNCVVEGAYSADCSAYLGDSKSADTVRFLSITDKVNRIRLETGRLPRTPDEIVIDAYKVPSIEPGTKLVIADETSDDSLKMFKYREYTVVGTARTPVYMNFQRGTSNEGSGSVSYYVCALPGAFDSEYYTEAYLYADTGLFIYSDEYKEWAKSSEAKYKVILKNVIDERFEDALREEYDKLYEGVDEFNEGIGDARKELEDARQKLDDAKKELEDAQAELDKNRAELDEGKATLDESAQQIYEYGQELYTTKAQLDAAQERAESSKAELDILEKEVSDLYEEITNGRSELRIARAEVASRRAILDYAVTSYRSSIEYLDKSIENNKAKLEEASNDWEKQWIEAQIKSGEDSRANLQKMLDDADKELKELDEKEAGFDDTEKSLNNKKKAYDSKIAAYNDKFQSYMSDKLQYEMGISSYESSKAQYDSAYAQYANGLAQYNDGLAQIEDAQEQIDDGWKEYKEGLYEYWKGYSEFENTAGNTFRINLEYGYEMLDSVDDPDTYILGRDKNTGYVCFDNDAQIVDGVTTVFPIFFFAIAALVCSTTMSRMVGDERGIIGTMRALGFSDLAIVMKFVIYSGLASVLGCILGFVGGTKLFPWVIWECYRMMYGFSDLTFTTSLPLFFFTLAASLLCTVGVTVVTALSALKGMPAELIRPKAPLPGKRILLEYAGFVWKRMKFLHKVSLRNVFRFKKRMWMMIVGIAGCTALLLTAFGLYDSVCNLVNVQYDNIMKYDLSVTFDDRYRQYELEDAAKAVSGLGISYDYAIVKNDQAKNNGSGYVRDVDMYISDDPSILKIFGLADDKTGEDMPWPEDGTIAISKKLAVKNNIKAGDSITLLYGDDEHEVTLVVSEIFMNYTFHYAYMTPDTYREAFGRPYTPETLLIKTENKLQGDSYKIASYLSENYDVKTWSATSDLRESFAKTMERMNYIIVLVAVCAALLAFIVLFNLNNINITERIREIATLKVMGFNRMETGAYVTRENILLVIMGYIVGIPFGFLLHRFVMSKIEMDMTTYDIRIIPMSFVYTIALVIIFSTIVNLVMQAKIEKIDMAESLKSAE